MTHKICFLKHSGEDRFRYNNGDSHHKKHLEKFFSFSSFVALGLMFGSISYVKASGFGDVKAFQKSSDSPSQELQMEDIEVIFNKFKDCETAIHALTPKELREFDASIDEIPISCTAGECFDCFDSPLDEGCQRLFSISPMANAMFKCKDTRNSKIVIFDKFEDDLRTAREREVLKREKFARKEAEHAKMHLQKMDKKRRAF